MCAFCNPYVCIYVHIQHIQINKKAYKIVYKHNRNRKLKMSTASIKAKSRESAYSQGLTKTKSIGRDSESQAGRQSDGCCEWCLELRRRGR